MANPDYHMVIKTDYPYPETAKMFNENYHKLIWGIDHLGGYCEMFPDAKTVECHQRVWQDMGGMREALYVQIKEVDANHSTVDIYGYFVYYFDGAVCAAIPLSNEPPKNVPWRCSPSTRKDGSPHQSQ